MKSIQQISVILLTFMSALNAYALQVTGEKAIESVMAFRGIVGDSAAFYITLTPGLHIVSLHNGEQLLETKQIVLHN